MDIIRAWNPDPKDIPKDKELVLCLINVYDKTGTRIVEAIDETGMVVHPDKQGKMTVFIPAPKHPKGAAA